MNNTNPTDPPVLTGNVTMAFAALLRELDAVGEGDLVDMVLSGDWSTLARGIDRWIDDAALAGLDVWRQRLNGGAS